MDSIDYKQKTDEELVDLLTTEKIASDQLESLLLDDSRAVHVRRLWISKEYSLNNELDKIPYKNYDYSLVKNACCENVLGFTAVPLGYAGPLLVDGKTYYIPLSTTEGCLVASTNRGCRALSSNGVHTAVYSDSMTQEAIVAFSDYLVALNFQRWIDASDNYRLMKKIFDGTSRFVKLKSVDATIVGCYVYLRFRSTTGDAIGKNLLSKATEAVLRELKEKYLSHMDMEVVSLSGNYCVEPAAMSWIDGRGKSVSSEAIVPAKVVQDVLKTTVESMIHLNTIKNLVGSAVAGAVGGNNAHSANIVAAIFIAAGQDVAQNVTSSSCITLMEATEAGDLWISCTMPCLSVGTVGGGTHLPGQQECLEKFFKCAGGNDDDPGANATQLGRLICATVLAAELSLMAALSSGVLVESHLKHNRSALNLTTLYKDKEKPSSSSSSGVVCLPKTLKIEIDYKQKADEELVDLLTKKTITSHQLESLLLDDSRAVHVRRLWISKENNLNNELDKIPYKNYDYSLVKNACCENVLGFTAVPLGYAGPLLVDGKKYCIPLSTTKGGLVASTNRGCRALSSNGVHTAVYSDSMTRGPVVAFSHISLALNFKRWIDASDNYRLMKKIFDGTSRFAKLQGIYSMVVGRYVYLRFCSTTGDAMGMNMVSKATEAVLRELKEKYLSHMDMEVVSLSGNYCVDKKPAAMNWIKGRGKSVSSEAIVPAKVVQDVLKTTVDTMVRLNTMKNLVGSAIAGAVGGYNADSSSIVTAIFIATGQDVAQNVTSSNCLTYMEATKAGDLQISCTMPCLEVGTVGGGTHLPGQQECLEKLLKCAGGNFDDPGANAAQLARLICATVLASELSSVAALSSSDLITSHLKHNRSALNLTTLDKEKPSSSSSSVADRLSKTLKIGGLQPESCSKVLT